MKHEPLATGYENVTLQEYGNSTVLTTRMAKDSITSEYEKFFKHDEEEIALEEDLWNS